VRPIQYYETHNFGNLNFGVFADQTKTLILFLKIIYATGYFREGVKGFTGFTVHI